MRSKSTIIDSLADIIENIDRISGYIAGMTRDEFAANHLVADAVQRCVERVCEAAHRRGPHAAVSIPDQPWADIRGMGNRWRHACDRVAIDVVWNTVTNRLSPLRSDTAQAVETLRSGRGDEPEPPWRNDGFLWANCHLLGAAEVLGLSPVTAKLPQPIEPQCDSLRPAS